MKNAFLKTLIVLTITLSTFSLFGQHADNKLVFGFSPGPYSDIFRLAIKPQLEKKGYTIEIKEFSDWVQPNIALNNGDLDANLFQHGIYLEKFSKDHNLSLSPLIRVPTAGLGLYSQKIKSLKQLKKGDELVLPNDPTNLARSLRFLAVNKIITFKKDINELTASEKDIDKNPYGLKISPIEAAQAPRSLGSATVAVIAGNYAIASGLSLDSAIVLEVLDDSLKNLIAVKTADIDKKFVKDIKEAVESEYFKNVIEDPKNIFKKFQKPEWYQSKWKIKK
jgi:D-methionine transport system substrate-binding protein